MNEMRRLKILVADDTDTDRLILESIVRKEGHHVVSACNGLETIQVYSAEKPDIVLLDALMPELDGFGAARKIKELAGDELVPIIFLTSLSDTESLVQCLDAGGDDFLSKPFSFTILTFALIALFVGSFIIYNTFSIIVAQRTREMALLRALGAGRRQVLNSVIDGLGRQRFRAQNIVGHGTHGIFFHGANPFTTHPPSDRKTEDGNDCRDPWKTQPEKHRDVVPPDELAESTAEQSQSQP